MGLLIKGLLGALVVVLIGVLAKTKNYAIAGLVPLFPTFALIAHYIVASERGIEALRATIVFGMWSILPYFIYLLSLWYFTGIIACRWRWQARWDAGGCAAWLLILGWSRFH